MGIFSNLSTIHSLLDEVIKLFLDELIKLFVTLVTFAPFHIALIEMIKVQNFYLFIRRTDKMCVYMLICSVCIQN